MIQTRAGFHHDYEVDAALSSRWLARVHGDARQVGVSRSEQRVRTAVGDHFDFIWRLLARLGVPSASVDDAAQEVFVIFARRQGDVRAGSERSFLYGTALRIASDLRRARSRRDVVDLDARVERIRDPAPDPEQLLAARQRVALLDSILEQLSDAQREVFVLFELEGMTLDECAALLELPRGTAASRLRAARAEFVSRAKRLRERYQQGGEP